MKHISIFIFSFFFIFILSGIAQNINPQLTQKTWVDDETRVINGFQVTRISGADYGNARNASYGMMTSIAYKELDGASKNQLEFYITRYEQSMANLKWFMIIIRGEDDKKKIFTKKLDYRAAELPEGNYFWNYTTIDLPENIHPPFYVYIRDRNMDLLYSTKFKIGE